jgi:hypothetical protein
MVAALPRLEPWREAPVCGSNRGCNENSKLDGLSKAYWIGDAGSKVV